MYRLKHSLVALAIVTALGVVITAVTSATSQGQGGNNQSPLLNVNVVNPATSPVPVREVFVPVPFQRTITTNLSEGDGGIGFTIDIPEGKLAVIEHVSFGAELPLGQVAKANITCQRSGTAAYVNLKIPFESQGAFEIIFDVPETMSVLVANSPVRCYADGNGGIVSGVTRNSKVGRTGEISFSVSGHLLDRP